jgi:hypothetical protein
MTLSNNPVVYISDSAYSSLLTDKDPWTVLTNQLATQANPHMQTDHVWTQGDLDEALGQHFRIRFIVVNHLSVDIEGRGNPTVYHGDETSQPVVLDASGTPRFKPSTDPAVTATPRLGDPLLDWIDAPPPSFASVGVWTFDQRIFSFAGASFVSHLSVTGGPDIVLSAIVNGWETEQAYTGLIVSGTVPDPDTVYDDLDNASTYPSKVEGSGVRLHLRWQKCDDDAYAFFALVEAAS